MEGLFMTENVFDFNLFDSHICFQCVCLCSEGCVDSNSSRQLHLKKCWFFFINLMRIFWHFVLLKIPFVWDAQRRSAAFAEA